MNEKKRRHGRDTVPTSVRISPTCNRLWERLSENMGVSKTAVIEFAVRALAESKGITDDGAGEKT